MVHLIKTFVTFVVKGIGYLILLLIGIYIVAQIRYKILSYQVEAFVAEEFAKLEFADELSKFRYDTNGSCRFSYKTGSTRCSVYKVRYYVSDAVPIEEFKRIDNHVRELGWTDWGYRDTEEEIERKFEKRISTFGIYTLHGKYKIDMHVHFYNENDKDDSNETINRFVNEYVDEYPTIYRVSIDADMVNNKL